MPLKIIIQDIVFQYLTSLDKHIILNLAPPEKRSKSIGNNYAVAILYIVYGKNFNTK